MPEIGYFLSSEEHEPTSLVRQAQLAEAAGLESVLVSDHYHPWTDRQGESPFVWSVIGAIAASTGLRVATGVTCPTVRIHPAVIAQAAATSHLLTEGRFVLGLGTGENLNEHITGAHWPPAAVRQEMLEEAVAVIRELFTGSLVSHRGRHFAVENARLYSVPEQPPRIAISAFGDDAVDLAARIGDGLVMVEPNAHRVHTYREQGGRGPVIGAVKVCWHEDEHQARKIAHELWATECLTGQLNQELALPSQFSEAARLVTEDMVADQIACGPDPERHVAAISRYLEAGFDEVYVNQIGSDQEGFFDLWAREIRPRLAA